MLNALTSPLIEPLSTVACVNVLAEFNNATPGINEAVIANDDVPAREPVNPLILVTEPEIFKDPDIIELPDVINPDEFIV